MSEKHLNPAKTVIGKVGGPERVAAVTGKHISRVYRWMYEKSRGGTGGSIPQADAEKLLAHAEAEGIDLTPADFFARSPKGEAA